MPAKESIAILVSPDAGSCPGNCSGVEEATGAPSSFADSGPKRLRASGRDGGSVMTRPPLPLTMLLSRHTKRRGKVAKIEGLPPKFLTVKRANDHERMLRLRECHCASALA